MASAVAGSLVGKNLAILLNLSTTTNTPVFPSDEVGRSVRKSMDMSCQGPAGAGRGCRSPAGLLEDSLLLWQMSHPPICLVTACWSLGDQNYFFILARVLWMPMWPNLSWYSSHRRSRWESGTTSWSLDVYNHPDLYLKPLWVPFAYALYLCNSGAASWACLSFYMKSVSWKLIACK